jgi:Tripartite tricarboxylate transporter TctB family
MTNRGGERLAAGALAALMLLWLWQARQLPYIVDGRPGPGFFPVWLAALGLALTLIILAGTFRRHQPDAPDPKAPPQDETQSTNQPERHVEPHQKTLGGDGAAQSTRAQALRLTGALAGLLAFLALMPLLGFVVGLAVYLLFLSLLVLRMRAVSGLAVSLGTVAFVYVVFGLLLNVPFPAGTIGI